MNDNLEIWEFTDNQPSGKKIWYQLEERAGVLSIHSDDPDFVSRKSDEPKLLEFLKYLLQRWGDRCSRADIDEELWHRRGSPTKVDTNLAKLRDLLNDDAQANPTAESRGGRIIQSLKTRDLRFALQVTHSEARIQKTSQFGPFSSVPALNLFVPRPEISEPLVTELCQPGSTSGVRLVGMAGMGGIGKTTLAVDLSHDKRVRERFSDGIIWLRFGHEVEKDFGRRVKSICDHLGQRFEEYSASALQTVLAVRSVLIVLDDIWDIEDLKPFRVASPGSCLLFTTRDKTIARSVGIIGQEVGALDPVQARSVLQRWSHREEDLPEPQASDILAECGGLALALSMIGATLGDRAFDRWERILRDLRKAKLKHIGSPLAEYSYTTIHAAIAVSVDALSNEIRGRYLSLAVLLEGTPAAGPILQALWGGDEDDLDQVTEVLIDRSLARREPAGIILHDLQLKFLRAEDENPESLNLQRAALRRSMHVLRDDPTQFASQMTGRLLSHSELPGMSQFLNKLKDCEPRPRLRPLLPSLSSPREASVLVLEDNSWNGVESVGINSDGSKAVFASWGGLFCWEKRTNKLRRVEFEHGRCKARLVGDRKHVFWCGLEQGALYRWDMDADNPPILITRLNESVIAFAITAEGARAAFLSEDGCRLAIYDISAGAAVLRLDSLEVSNEAFDISEDGGRVVFACKDKLSVWDLDKLNELAVVKLVGDVGSVAMTRDGRQCVFSHGERSPNAVSLLDIDDRDSTRTLWIDPLSITSICVSDDGKRVAGAGQRGRIVVCELFRNNTLREYRGPDRDGELMLAMSADGRSGFSASFGTRPCTLWDFEAPPSFNHSVDCKAIAVTPDSRRAIMVRRDGALTVWSLSDKPQALTIAGPSGDFFGHYGNLSLSEDGAYALAGTSYVGGLSYWNTELDQAPLVLSPPRRIDDDTCYEGPCVLSCNGKRALAKQRNGPVVIWEFEENRALSHPLRNSDNTTAFAMAGDGEYGLLGMSDGTINLWNLNKREPGAVLGSHRSAVTQLIFVRTDRLVSISKNGDVVVWDFIGDQVQSHHIASHDCGEFAFSANGKWMFSISRSPEITRRYAAILWDLDARTTRNCVLPITSGCVDSPALNNDGNLIAWVDRQKLAVCDVFREIQLSSYTADGSLICLRWAGSRIIASDDTGRTHILAWEAT